MSDTLLAASLGAVLCGLLGLLAPRLVAAPPEPEEDVWAQDAEAAEGDDESARPAPPDAKPLYTDLAAAPGLALRCAVVAAVCGGLIGWATGLDWSLVWLVPLVPVAVALSVIDWHTRLLPRVLVLPATWLALVAVTAVGLLTDQRDALVRALLAMLAVRSFFWLLWRIRSGGMGFGDVRLAAIVGLVLGWVGWGAVVIGVWVGFFAFATPGLALAIVKRDRSLLRKPFPYGPFMLVGALVGLVWGTSFAERIWG